MPINLYQKIARETSRWLGSFFLRMEVRGIGNIKTAPKTGVIFISNHPNKWDPFLISAAMPYQYFKNQKGLHFMSHPKYTDGKWYGKIIKLIGAYPVYPKKGEYENTLASTVELLRQGENLVIFPSGKLRGEFHASEARPGIAYLSKQLQSIVIPVYLSYQNEMTVINFILRRCRVKISIGAPFKSSEIYDKQDSLLVAARKIMTKVEALA